MKTIRAVYHAGCLRPLDPLNLPEDSTVTIAVLEDDDLPAAGQMQASEESGALDFLLDPREDIYTLSDGEPI